MPLYVLSLFPILAAIFGAIGLATFDETKHKAKWMPTAALALDILFTLISLSRHW